MEPGLVWRSPAPRKLRRMSVMREHRLLAVLLMKPKPRPAAGFSIGRLLPDSLAIAIPAINGDIL